ncbi:MULTISPECIES: type 1 glutamine amidotransferase [Commensalibacter]|uniref:Glutamine amidotransferase domain-containing protein n=2 Tax=Commensalibacter TaxID=1079922 RepID=W7DTY6_9PROT|nr:MULTISPECIES: type 1 glutamine amidotransferase [Commensalibacter]EUK18480.1 hypothetical protein COMX_01990 [Commensalibacter papalotli (ex Servin-Garciduenas et al. 2014)]CAI3933019.1 GMP synthase [Commensalibacter papalotli (ex Botero et al. 2024)]CAI3942661.1 GMP synthase [Commensalibacter papalotli (ex Botero et al. 2024)]
MRAIILQHTISDGPGYILSWLHEQGFATDICFLYKQDSPLPNVDSASLLIILNGPMSVHDEDQYPWLKKEKELIKQAIEKNIPTLGVCFGAQLIANIYGAKVSPAPHKAIGWFPIKGESTTKKGCFHFPDNFTSLFWHTDEFEIPENATLLASSQICKNQAFQIKKNAIGIQFHPQTTPYLLQGLINSSSLDLTNDLYIQPTQQLLSAPASFFVQTNQLVNDVISYLLIRSKKK